jgi:hypothetical protein
MRLALRALVFATGFLIGGEALRRWLEHQEAEAPPASPRHLRAVPSSAPPVPAPAPPPAPPATAAATKAELYERAKKLDVEGRSKMSKSELAAAVARAEGRRA